MNYRIEFLSIAEEELEDAFDWYESQMTGLGASFLESIHSLIQNVSDAPRLYQKAHNKMRKASLKRFPYSIVYEIHDPEVILILAVIHQKRSPEKWENR